MSKPVKEWPKSERPREYYARPGQRLSEHLRNVAALAKKFAEGARPGDAAFAESAYFAGLLHDVGKYSDAFREMLSTVALGAPKRLVEHSGHGAALAADAGCYEIAWAVAGHHAGLHDREDVKNLRRRKEWNAASATGLLKRARFLVQAIDRGGEIPELAAPWPPSLRTTAREPLALDLRIRMLFSCLIDADRLDSECFENLEAFDTRQRAYASLDASQLLNSLCDYVGRLRNLASDTELNRQRQRVLEACLQAARESPGLFTLTVPTGGGKTLAAMAFALQHAAAHHLRRVIVVIPYLSIIEQNAGVYRQALGHEESDGKRLVLEHHSAVRDESAGAADGDDESPDAPAISRRLAAENWDAPVVVTTSVQFFESLFSNRPAACRKLHNIAQSVVILDEVQTFPSEVLAPILEVIDGLARDYGTSFVFCTATQPALERHPCPGFDLEGSDGRWAHGTLREIFPEYPQLFRVLKRVEVRWPGGDTLLRWSEVADRMVERKIALCIVNTKEQARTLFSQLLQVSKGVGLPGEAVFHLSTRMCPQHRMDLLGEGQSPPIGSIRQRLQDREPCLVVSTQLIEAGVDVDFPIVFRAFGPLDSIVQSAGRCNREGKLARGEVVVFKTEDGALPPDAYRQATHVTETLLSVNGSLAIDEPELFRRYFDLFYGSRTLDARQIQAMRCQLDFPKTAEAFRIIDERTHPVLVPYREGKARIEEIRQLGRLTRDLGRRLQRYTVGLYEYEWIEALKLGVVAQVGETGTFECMSPCYHPHIGVTIESADPLTLIVVR